MKWFNRMKDHDAKKERLQIRSAPFYKWSEVFFPSNCKITYDVLPFPIID